MSSADVERYLENEAQLLRSRGIQTTTRVLVGGDIPRAIDEGVNTLGADFVVVPTHGMARNERMARGTIAWKTLAHSPVPILLRHSQEGQARDLDEPAPDPINIMVPLDGSANAERAVAIATNLAAQWQGSVILVQVLPHAVGGQEYLDRVAQGAQGAVQTKLLEGQAADTLVRAVTDLNISHVVMTSHGRTGLSRVMAGDIAADLIDRLSIPIIVVPLSVSAKATGERKEEVGRESGGHAGAEQST